ncbi:hypothetical protein ACF05T_14640 [Streptomyces lateritius]|uniref:Uncharacterized protein n=1 Tax=Streptomyces lateritius TaxID=67313 RepID=A0ABW6YBX5_9ACTN
MLISHIAREGTLHVTLNQHLDITNRAAAALQIEALVYAHQPAEVTLELPAGETTPATLSAVARARRMCQSIGVPLTLTGSGASLADRNAGPASPRRLEYGARQDH